MVPFKTEQAQFPVAVQKGCVLPYIVMVQPMEMKSSLKTEIGSFVIDTSSSAP